MLSFPSALRVYVSLDFCDMRKGYEGLSSLVENSLKEDLRGGTLFVFTNRKRTRLKMIYFDGTGLWLLSKRLEQGTFSWPQSTDENCSKMLLRPEALAMLTDGVDLKGAKLRPWYEREK